MDTLHLAISGDFHLFDLTRRMHSDMVFNESMNRPLEQFRLKWNGSGQSSNLVTFDAEILEGFWSYRTNLNQT